MKKKSLLSGLLLSGMALMIPCYLFAAGNTLFSPWTLYDRKIPLLVLFCVLALVLILLLFRAAEKRERQFEKHEKIITAGALLFYFAVQMALGLVFRHEPFTDAEQCWTAAQLIVDTGTFSSSARAVQYFGWYPHNLPFVYLMAAIFRFFRFFGWTDRYAQVLLVGCLLFSAGLFCGIQTAKQLGGMRSQMHLLILCGTALPLLYFPAELYTDAYSIAFCMMTVYFTLRALNAGKPFGKALWCLAMAAATFAGMQIRFTCLITGIACLLALLFQKKIRLTALCAAMLAFFCVFGGMAIDRETAKHLDPDYVAVKKLPKLHYIVMGFPAKEQDGYGQYGDGWWLKFSDSFDDPGERNSVLLSSLKDHLYYVRTPARMLSLISRKNLSTFGNGTFGLGSLIQADEKDTSGLKEIVYPSGKYYSLYYHLCTGIFAAQMLLAVLACIRSVRRRNTGPAMLYLTLLGAYLFLCIWETQPRYFFQFLPVLLCAGAMEGRKRSI